MCGQLTENDLEAQVQSVISGTSGIILALATASGIFYSEGSGAPYRNF